MSGIEAHRAAVGRALDAQGLGWDAWPDVVLDARLPPGVRLSAVLLLLATDEGEEPSPGAPLAAVVRLLGGLGPRKPSKTWLAAIDAALRPAGPAGCPRSPGPASCWGSWPGEARHTTAHPGSLKPSR